MMPKFRSIILSPLGMTNTSVHLPPSQDFVSKAAEGYIPVDGKYEAFGNEFLALAPAGHLE